MDFLKFHLRKILFRDISEKNAEPSCRTEEKHIYEKEPWLHFQIEKTMILFLFIFTNISLSVLPVVSVAFQSLPATSDSLHSVP